MQQEESNIMAQELAKIALVEIPTSRCMLSSHMKYKLPKFQKDDLVVIHFLDHAEDGGALEFRVVGWVAKFDSKSIEVLSWDYPIGSPFRDDDIEDTNLKRFSIVKSTIIKMKVIQEDVSPPIPVAPPGAMK